VKLLKELCETSGIPGHEERLRAIVKRELKSVADELRIDAMGNLICVKRIRLKKGIPPRKLMIAAHMDEIGFVVTHVDNKGFLRIAPLGGHDPRNMIAQRVLVGVKGRKELPGLLYPEMKPTHLLTEEERKRQPQVSDFFVDLGLPAAKVKKLVEIGAPVNIHRKFIELGDCVSCKAMDNRLALYVMTRAMQQAKRFAFETYAVATVQEEVGLRGATTGAYGVDPDVGVALDTTIAADLPGIPEHLQVTRLGAGTAIKILDSSLICHRKLVDFFKELAKKRRIPHQMEILPCGGTDAGAIQRARSGIPALTLSTPCRYVHSSVETLHTKDVEATVKLITAFLEEGDRADLAPE
jgi:endoglucanase